MAVARYYRPDKNKEGASFPGVPLRDVEDEEWEQYPTWLQKSVDASEMYQKSKPDEPTPRRTRKEEEG